jgi:hypothetical protein
MNPSAQISHPTGLPPTFRRVQFACGMVGLICLSICLVAGFFLEYLEEFSIAILPSLLYWLGLGIGSLYLLMIHTLLRGRWGFMSQRFLEAATLTVGVMALFLLPVFLQLDVLYLWARPELVKGDVLLMKKQAWLNPTGFTIRSILYVLIWIGMALLLRTWSRRQDETSDLTPTRKMRSLSGIGLVILTFSGTFAAIDWAMSVEPHWFSTMFPVLTLVNAILSAIALMILILSWFKDYEPFAGKVSALHFHQLGNMLMAFVLLWTYMAFAQFLIVWSANLPLEIEWYLHRISGSWVWVIVFLAIFHFFLPFVLLLIRENKKRVDRLRWLALAVLVAQFVEQLWIFKPAYYQRGVFIHWLDVLMFIAMGGLWAAAFCFFIARARLLPRNDPRLEEVH